MIFCYINIIGKFKTQFINYQIITKKYAKKITFYS